MFTAKNRKELFLVFCQRSYLLMVENALILFALQG